MNNLRDSRLRISFWIALLCGLLGSMQNLAAQVMHGMSDPKHRPPRTYDLIHTALDIRLDHANRRVSGSVTHTLDPIVPSLTTIRFDADTSIKVSEIVVDGVPTSFRHDTTGLFIDMERSRRPGDTITVVVHYKVTPRKGIYMVSAEENEEGGRDQIWTQGEGEDHRYWIPTYDYPDDLATSEIRATVRGDWRLLSNGERKSVVDNSDGTKTWHYAMEKPHATYLLMIAAGDFLITHATVDGIPLSYWTYPDAPEKVPVTFDVTPDIITYFDSLIGYPYPWGSYAQVVVDEFMYGGMENTTATVLNDDLLVDAIEKIDTDPTDVIAHEIAHQWFGDLVTCTTWEHLWLNESFATYLAARYLGSRYGEDVFLKKLYDWRSYARYRDTAHGRHPIVSPTPHVDLVYGRGAFVLHMLNQAVGEEVFWKAVRLYLDRNKHGNVETKDLQEAFEEVTDYSWGWFFDQWVYGAGMPDVSLTMFIDDDHDPVVAPGLLVYSVTQNVHDDSSTLFTRYPVVVDRYMNVSRDWSRVNTERTLFHMVPDEDGRPILTLTNYNGPIADAEFDALFIPYPEASFLGYIDDGSDYSTWLTRLRVAIAGIDRLDAAERLTDYFANDSIVTTALESEVSSLLTSRFLIESVPFVRAEMIRLAANIDDKQAVSLITLGLSDPSRDVRLAAVNAAWRLDSDTLIARLMPMLHDSSRSVVAAALAMLDDKSKVDLRPILRELQAIPGRRESLAQTWIAVVGHRKYEEFYDRIVWYARYGNQNRTRINGLNAIARFDETNEQVRDAIAAGLRDESEEVFKAAMKAYDEHDDDEMEELAREALARLDEERAATLLKEIDD